MNASQEQSLRAAAEAAIQEKDGHEAQRLYDQLVEQIKRAVGDNQKEIAAELQRLAKEIEAEGRAEEAFDFKQRTCAVLLKLSMSARGVRDPLPLAVSPSTAPLPGMKLEYLILGTINFETEKHFFSEVVNARQIWSAGHPQQKAIAFELGAGPPLVLYEQRMPGWQPVFSAADPDKITRELEKLGWSKEADELLLPSQVKARQFCDRIGNKIALVRR